MTVMSQLPRHHVDCGGVADAQFPSISATFGNDEIALQAPVAVVDRSHWGKILVLGEDRLRFLHNQSTADFLAARVGDCLDTVFINSTGRTIDLATAVIQPDGVLLLVSPGQGQKLLELLDRYIFFADKVTLVNQSETWSALSTIGPESNNLLQALGGDLVPGTQQIELGNISITAIANNGLGLPGHTFLVESQDAGELWQKIVAGGAVPLGERGWEELRIRQGRPAVERELTNDYNPLEVGLWRTISFSKGCYIGQETIARLNTYKGVKQYLWGIELSEAVAIGSDLTIEGEKVGILTSCIQGTAGVRGLAYVKSKVGGVGLKVAVGAAQGEIVAVPFVSHEYPS
jgi:tRNA-modifying protein YgfZ